MTELAKRTEKTGQPGQVARRLFFLGVVFLQIALLRYVSTLRYMPLRDSAALLDQIAALLPAAVKASLLTGSVALAVRLARADKQTRWAQVAEHRPSHLVLTLNFVCFLILGGFFVLARQAGAADGPGWLTLGLRLSPVFWVGLLASWAGFVAPVSAWRQAFAQNYVLGLIVFLISFISFHSLDAELAGRIGAALIGPTLFLSSRIYSLTGETVSVVGYSPEGNPIFGSREFFGQIGPACSGYEGMVLSAAFLGIFFYLEPVKLSVLRKGLVILLACVAIFLLNALRLAMLTYIGVHFSPEIAQEGFHTNFGLVAVIVVVITAVASTRAVAAPSPPEKDAGFQNFEEGAPRLLLPLIYLIGSSLLCGLVSGKFFWLYPLPIIAAAAGLYQIRDDLRSLRLELTPTTFLLASATLLAWVQLVPSDATESDVFQETLFSAPFPLIVLWLIWRLIGAAVIVPVVEELAFRGAFTDFLQAALRRYWTDKAARIGAMVAVAVLFGVVHSNFLAGTIAGLAFGVARWRRNELGDAIVCHGLTNLMLAFYILVSGNWSYWT
jgi:exosortase E/protease (VPEID-CTERM system)